MRMARQWELKEEENAHENTHQHSIINFSHVYGEGRHELVSIIEKYETMWESHIEQTKV